MIQHVFIHVKKRKDGHIHICLYLQKIFPGTQNRVASEEVSCGTGAGDKTFIF